MILSFIVMIGLILGYLNFSELEEEPASTISKESIINKSDIELFSVFGVDFSVFESETYKSLEIFGESPVDIGTTGQKKNPFAPF